MWMVDPKILCRNHLLGEHVEIHMFIGTIKKGYSIKGYIKKGLLEVHNLYNRHEELAKEMKRRNYRHNSKIGIKWKQADKQGLINKEKNLKEIIKRCLKCRERYRSKL
jgi:hypothetical protein